MQENKPTNEQKKSVGQWFCDIFVPNKNDDKRQRMGKIIAICVAVLVIAAIVIGCVVINKYAVGGNNAESAANLYPSSDKASSAEGASSGESSGEEEDEEKPGGDLDPETGVIPSFNELYKQNEDVVGFIKIDGTKLNLPVVQWRDKAYYLDHTLDHKSNPFGVPFADYRATFSPVIQSNNITVYGHSGKDGSYFAPVKEYKNFDFYKEHPVITFDTIYGQGQYKVIGLMMLNTDINMDSNPELFNFHDYVDMDPAQFEYYIKTVSERSYFHTGVDVKYGDQLLALSTCDTEVENSNSTPFRMALIARKVRPGESEEVDVSKASINKNVEMPKEWVKKYKKQTPFE